MLCASPAWPICGLLGGEYLVDHIGWSHDGWPHDLLLAGCVLFGGGISSLSLCVGRNTSQPTTIGSSLCKIAVALLPAIFTLLDVRFGDKVSLYIMIWLSSFLSLLVALEDEKQLCARMKKSERTQAFILKMVNKHSLLMTSASNLDYGSSSGSFFPVELKDNNDKQEKEEEKYDDASDKNTNKNDSLNQNNDKEEEDSTVDPISSNPTTNSTLPPNFSQKGVTSPVETANDHILQRKQAVTRLSTEKIGELLRYLVRLIKKLWPVERCPKNYQSTKENVSVKIELSQRGLQPRVLSQALQKKGYSTPQAYYALDQLDKTLNTIQKEKQKDFGQALNTLFQQLGLAQLMMEKEKTKQLKAKARSDEANAKAKSDEAKSEKEKTKQLKAKAKSDKAKTELVKAQKSNFDAFMQQGFSKEQALKAVYGIS